MTGMVTEKRQRAVIDGVEQDYVPAGEALSKAFEESQADQKAKRKAASAALEAHRTVWQRYVRRFRYRMAGSAVLTNIIAWEARLCGIDVTDAEQILWFTALEPMQRFDLCGLTRKCRHESRSKSFKKNNLEQYHRTPAMRIVK